MRKVLCRVKKYFWRTAVIPPRGRNLVEGTVEGTLVRFVSLQRKSKLFMYVFTMKIDHVNCPRAHYMQQEYKNMIKLRPVTRLLKFNICLNYK